MSRGETQKSSFVKPATHHQQAGQRHATIPNIRFKNSYEKHQKQNKEI